MLALGAVGVTQLAIALAQLFGPATHHRDVVTGLSTHLFDEGSAWNLALGIGLLYAALRTERAAGLLPTLGWFVGVLAILSTADLLNGAATVERVASHLPLVVALVLLHLVRREHQDQPTPGRPGVDDEDGHHFSTSDRPRTPPGRRPGGRLRLTPTGSRAA